MAEPTLEPVTHWLVKWPGAEPCVMPDDLFTEFVDVVKYDGVEYEAEPLRRAPQPGEKQ